MSTDKFNIDEMGVGNDTHSNVLTRLGYGDLLNRPGRKEVTLDTASMYKKAADATTMLTGAGAVAGGLSGNMIADSVKLSPMGRLLITLAGAGAGGAGGYFVGKSMDNNRINGIPQSHRDRAAVNAAAIGSLGALAGYGTSKYILGSDNKVHNTLGALAGGTIGALVGGNIASKTDRTPESDKEINAMADKLGLTGEKRDAFIRDYDAAISEEKNRSGLVDTLQSVVGNNPTEMDKVVAKYKGEDIPTESWVSWWKTPILANEAVHTIGAVGGGSSKALKGEATRNLFEYIGDRTLSYTGRIHRASPKSRLTYTLPSILNNKLVRNTAMALRSPQIKNKALRIALSALSRGKVRI